MKPITRLFYILLGILISSYIIFVRFIINRIPKELYIFEPTQYKMIILISLWITISIYMFYKNIKLLKKSTRENYFVQQVMLKISTIIDNALREFYRFIAGFFPNNYDSISSFCKYFYDVFGLRNENILIIISVIIRFIIVIALIIDVFIFFKIKYFYKALFLLCITLIINIIIYILRDFASNLDKVKDYLIIITENQSITYKPSPGNEDIDLVYHVNEFIIISKISGYLEVYDFLTMYYDPKINLFIYSLYFIIWSYVLIFNIFFVLL